MQFSRLLLLAAAYILALLIFQKGFLLKRQTLSNKSVCNDVFAAPDCWISPVYNKTVWLIIDALRFDFVDPIHPTQVNLAERYFRGKMPKIGQLLQEKPKHARLYEFEADAPTTTLQRLKALVTGTLPTFIEAGDNFGGTNILEDNLIDQFKDSGKKLVFLGDDTWTSILPKRFDREFPAPSFDIKDLHTVDDLVEEKIHLEMKRNDWQVLVAHCLGVDHCGHRYGPDHPEMAKKLQQMDNLVSKIVEELPEDAILVVCGDHGMTLTGDHGGDSKNETGAALFVYSRKQLPENSQQKVKQIDLVPTLSLLMDVPIPFSNLGLVIPDLVPEHLRNQFLKLNCMQIVRFAQNYLQHEPSLAAYLDWIFREFEAAAENDPKQAVETIGKVQKVLRDAWTSFDLRLAILGIVALIEAVCFNAVHLTASIVQANGEFFASITVAVWLFRSGILLLELSLFMSGGDDELVISLLHVSLLLSIAYHVIVFILQLLSLKFNWKYFAIFATTAAYSASFLSNSFIIYEPSVVRFQLQTLFAFSAYFFLQKLWSTRKSNIWKIANQKKLLTLFLIMGAIRLGAVFEKCREEQVDCQQTVFSSTLSSLPTDSVKVLRFLLGSVALFGTNFFLVKNAENEKSDYLRVVNAISWPTCILINFHWLCDFISAKFDLASLRTAQMVYGIFVVVFLVSTIFQKKKRASLAMIHFFVLVLAMILGDGLAPSLFLLIFIQDAGLEFFDDSVSKAFFTSFLVAHGFFSLAHTATLAQIPWQAAFIGIPGNFAFQAVPGALVILHIFASCVLLVWRNSSLKDSNDSTNLALLAIGSFKACGVCLAALFHRRHLMLFKIFAPKFIYEGIGFILLCLALLFFQMVKSVKK